MGGGLGCLGVSPCSIKFHKSAIYKAVCGVTPHCVSPPTIACGIFFCGLAAAGVCVTRLVRPQFFLMTFDFLPINKKKIGQNKKSVKCFFYFGRFFFYFL